MPDALAAAASTIAWMAGRAVHTSADLGRGLAIRILKDAGFSADDYVRLR